MTGRPTKYTQEIADDICKARAEGMSVGNLCKTFDICGATLWLWRKNHEDFSNNYERATEIKLEREFDEIENYADEYLEDSVKLRAIVDTDEHEFAFDSARVSAAKLKVDTRKWRLGHQLGGLAKKKDEEETEAKGNAQFVVHVVEKKKRDD